ncbi:hypothetical protein [Methylosinus sp. PW1]|uniref:hypothetical protein n=1 Tax=Methylosinus sp. PW1 TaxID=107636 RepID=UPI00055A09C9|nr:hypothetical protein [Methylosinus sp. PW1]
MSDNDTVFDDQHHEFINDNESAIVNLVDFIADYTKLSAAEVAKKYDIARTLVGNGAALLQGLGFNVVKEEPSADFDKELAKTLFVGGATTRAIAKHLSARAGAEVKTHAVTAYLRKEGLIKQSVAIDTILAKKAA